MRLPPLSVLATSRAYTQEFRGYNHNLRIGDGEFYTTTNLTADHYPLLSPRGRRGTVTNIDDPQGMIEKDGLAYIDGPNIVFDGKVIEMGLDISPESRPKQLVGMGAYILVFPDGKFLNTEDITDAGSLGATFSTTGAVSFTLCMEDGTPYEGIVVGDKAPEKPEPGAAWIDTSSTPHSLKIYSDALQLWNTVGTTYVKISAANIGKAFERYDGVFISGCTAAGTTELNNTAVIWQKGDDYIVVIGILDEVTTQTDPVTVERRIPNLDYVTESNNRLWGCRYGMQKNGQIVNEIYACKLGDPKNWYCFQGVSTDSYTVSLGSDGIFTGAATHGGHPIFFKENCFHKVFGEVPSNFQMQTMVCRGVQPGCWRSLAIVNEILYYKSQTGIMAFDGSLPVSVSPQLGEITYSDAVAGAFGNKYYVSMKDGQGDWSLFVYDSKFQTWMREDGLHAQAICRSRGELFAIDADDHNLLALRGTTGLLEPYVEWSATTGEIGYSSPDHKYISRFNIRMKLEQGSSCNIYARYDSCGPWEFKGRMAGKNIQSFTLPVVPKRCDHMALRFDGKGDCKIYSIAKVMEEGSDAE